LLSLDYGAEYHLEMGRVGRVEAAHNQHEVNPLLWVTLLLNKLSDSILAFL
jgi:hypothetical protein